MTVMKDIARSEDVCQSAGIEAVERPKIEAGECKPASLERSDLLDPSTYEKNHPYLWCFADCTWSIFGTLTFADRSRRLYSFDAEALRHHDFNGLLTAACVRFGFKRKLLPYYHATEWTEAQECHLHFLIAKDSRLKVDAETLAYFLQDYWTTEFKVHGRTRKGAGTADVRPYEQAKGLRGVSYCLKRDLTEESFYRGNERERFDCLSPQLFALLKVKSRLN